MNSQLRIMTVNCYFVQLVLAYYLSRILPPVLQPPLASRHIFHKVDKFCRPSPWIVMWALAAAAHYGLAVIMVVLYPLYTHQYTVCIKKLNHGFQSRRNPSSLYVHTRFWWGWWHIPMTSFSWTCSNNDTFNNQLHPCASSLFHKATAHGWNIFLIHFRLKIVSVTN